jgi:hypothetical protein
MLFEEFMQVNERVYREIFNATSDAIFIQDATSGAILDVNQSMLDMYGYRYEEAIQLSVNQLSLGEPPYTQVEADNWIRKALGEGPQIFEWVARKKNSESFWVEVVLRRTDIAGQTRILAVVRDITERKLAALELRKSEERYRLISQIMSDYTFYTSLVESNQVIYEWVAGAFEKITGFTFDDYLAHGGWRSILHPDDLAIDDHDFQLLMKNQAVVSELRILSKAGQTRWVRIYAYPVWDQMGDCLLGISGAVQEISAQKLAEQKIMQLNASLEQRVRERTQELEAKARELETFAYSVSHDLKAPLRGIDGYSRLLQEDHVDSLNAEGQLFLKHIREAVGRMNQLIEDLLTYARLEQRLLVRQPVDAALIIQHVLDERRPEISARQVQIVLNLQSSWVMAESEGLTQVLRNLIDNALKFTHTTQRPVIEIGCAEVQPHDLLWVKDNGVGFDMQYQDRIFEIFQRLHRSEDYPGTGIGLAIVRKVIERLGGRVWAESALNSGSTFFVELPHT